jgi:hypothetical protein
MPAGERSELQPSYLFASDEHLAATWWYSHAA